ncbi:UDP-glucuronosyltransferase 2A1-like isoform X3 [Alosa sapidissima]|uniref:UDP-glucuronosyltransferase 2A1-like isoform X3 n=1 Tax=Alosa sapidissima TaxID=34773 RepID=UPI001C08D553|nr:UDP-glucuronosyltransferase 2A1-like isoform X3 [Alosa sapidissima]
MLSNVLLALSVLSVCLSGARGGKVLVFPVDGSHWLNMRVIIEELHSRGHSITVVRASNSWHIKKDSPYYTSHTIEMGPYQDDVVDELASTLLQLRMEGRSFFKDMTLGNSVVERFSEMHRDICTMVATIFEDENLMRSLREAKYDLVLTDPAFGGGVFLARRLQLPMVFNVRWTVHGEAHFAIAPSPLSYVPFPGAELTDKMTFSKRVSNIIAFTISQSMYKKMTDAHYTALCKRFFGPDVDYFSLFQDADIWLMRNDFTFEFPRPTMPNVVYMGGFQCKPARPLPVDLEEFVQSSGEHGVIIMSLGTLFAELPSVITEEIAAAFAQLPQKVIWRYTGAKPSTLGNNTLLVDWMPQNDLLGHAKTKVFVAHGGTNGIQEAIYHGVPILGLPLVFDQPDNLSRMVARGTSKVVDIATLDRAVFVESLKEVLYEPSYRENMQRLSRIHHDQPMKPLDRAIFWIEFVMRNGGAPHLRTQSFRMSWIAYHSIDVILTLLMALLLLLLIMFLAIKKCCSLLFRKKVKSE